MVETLLTCVDDVNSNQSLDYFFEFFVDDDDLKNEDKVINFPNLLIYSQKLLSIDGNSLTVQRFLIDDYRHLIENELFKKKSHIQLSDHYGVSMDLVYNIKEDMDISKHSVAYIEVKKEDEEKTLLK